MSFLTYVKATLLLLVYSPGHTTTLVQRQRGLRKGVSASGWDHWGQLLPQIGVMISDLQKSQLTHRQVKSLDQGHG